MEKEIEVRPPEFRYALQVVPVLTDTGEKVGARIVEIVAIPTNYAVGDEFTQMVDDRHRIRWAARYKMFKNRPYDPLKDISLIFPYCLPDVRDYVKFACNTLLDLADLPNEPKELLEAVESDETRIAIIENISLLKSIGEALRENAKIEPKVAVKR